MRDNQNKHNVFVNNRRTCVRRKHCLLLGGQWSSVVVTGEWWAVV